MLDFQQDLQQVLNNLFINNKIPVESALNFNGRVMNVGTSYRAGS